MIADLRDLLPHDALHDLLDRPLLREPVGSFAVVRLQLVAQAPVRDEGRLRGEAQGLVRGVDQAVHLDVVAGDVLVGGGERLRHLLGDLRRNAHRPAVHHARAGPALARPPSPLGEANRKRIHRVVQQREERDLRLEEVVVDVRGEVEVPQLQVEGRNRPRVQILRRQEHPADFEQVPVDLFHRGLQAGELRGERGLVGQEVVDAKRGEGRSVAVLREPPLRDLGDALTGAGVRGRALPGDDLRYRRIDDRVGDRRNRRRGECERRHHRGQGEYDRESNHGNLNRGQSPFSYQIGIRGDL